MESQREIKESALFRGLYPKGFSPYRVRWFDILIAVLLFFLSATVYIRTITPSVTAGDSGELTTAVYNMGACHPPGYPLYGILGKLFTFIPIGDIGYRVNLFSAISAAAAIFMFYLILVKLLGMNRKEQFPSFSVHIPAIAGAVLFAFSRTNWSQAVIGEVYALNIFLVALMIYVMLIWYEEIIYFRHSEKPHFAERLTFLLALVMGLSVTDHQLPVWYVIGFVLFLAPPTLILIMGRHAPSVDKAFEKHLGGIFSAFNIGFAALVVLLALMILVGNTSVILALLLLFFVYGAVFYLIYSDGKNNKSPMGKQLADRLIVIAVFIAIAILSGGLFYKYVYNSNLILPQNMPVIWVSIFLLPVSLTVYTLYAKLVIKEDNWVDNLIYLITIAFWLLIFAVSLYLYLMNRAKALVSLTEPKPLSWGDTRSFDILLNQMLRKQYGRPGSSVSNYFGQLKALFNLSVVQFNWVNYIFVGIGLIYMFFKEKVWAFFTLMSTLFFIVIMTRFINFEVDPRSMAIQEVMFIQAFMIMAIYAAFGYQLLFDAKNIFVKIKNGDGYR